MANMNIDSRPSFFISKFQKRKKQRVSDMIGRMFFINPSDEKRFSLRLLLLNVKGATSFNDLRTFEDIPYTTFKACAIARGLLQDDKIWDETLTEAALFTTDTRKLRVLFAMILNFGNPSDPLKLWEKHKVSLSADIIYNEKIRLNVQQLEINTDIINLSLYHLNEILETYKKSLINFPPMPLLPPNYNPNDTLLTNFETNKFIRAETAYNRETLKIFSDDAILKLNQNQLAVFNHLMDSTEEINKQGQLYFVDGPGGCGKTFLYNAILAEKDPKEKLL